MATNGCIWLDMAGNGWKGLKILANSWKMGGHGLKLFKIAGNSLQMSKNNSKRK